MGEAMDRAMDVQAGGPELSGNAASAVFEREWRTYRKMVDNDYLFHRQAYDALGAVLRDEVARPFRFLDIACGDAGETSRILTGTAVARYDGIDLSEPALEIAAGNLAGLGCPVSLRRGELAETLAAWREPVDVAWIGLSLHHFLAPGKGAILARLRDILAPGGLLLFYENVSHEGETRAAWLDRWDAQRPAWAEYTDEEWETITAHVHSSDYPEADSEWRRLGAAAGFTAMDELYRAPTDLFRLYRLATPAEA